VQTAWSAHFNELISSKQFKWLLHFVTKISGGIVIKLVSALNSYACLSDQTARKLIAVQQPGGLVFL
jgi:hypothetical protein